MRVKKCIEKTQRIWQYPKIDSLNGQKHSWRAYREAWGSIAQEGGGKPCSNLPLIAVTPKVGSSFRYLTTLTEKSLGCWAGNLTQ